MGFNFKELIPYIDLTSLNETDTFESITTFCQKAVTPFGTVAAICVYPQFVQQVVSIHPDIPVATVINFPSGNEELNHVCEQIAQSIEKGASEIDVVFPYQSYVQGRREEAIRFIGACKKQVGNILLKVILETGALKNLTLIKQAAQAVIQAGADFVKTSTGKIAIGATLEAARSILSAIQETCRPVGLKVSGGIKEPNQALEYLDLVKEVMGKNWVSPKTFRIGSSQLIDKLLI